MRTYSCIYIHTYAFVAPELLESGEGGGRGRLMRQTPTFVISIRAAHVCVHVCVRGCAAKFRSPEVVD